MKREYATNVLDGHYEDDRFFGVIYTLDEDDEFTDPGVWIKANPNLEYKIGEDERGRAIIRGSVKPDHIAGRVQKAQNSPVERYDVLTKNFNVWMANAVSWANLEFWDKCEVKNITPDAWLASFKDAKAVYGGLDLASVSDLASLALVAIMPNGERRHWVRSYVPESKVMQKVAEKGVPYDQWVKDGWLVATPGNRINYSFIRADLLGRFDTAGNELSPGLLKYLPVEKIGADDWATDSFFQDVSEEARAKFGAVRQGFRSMSPAMKEFETWYMEEGESQGISHIGNPVMRWAMSNVIAVVDAAENVKPDKDKSKDKIDPVVATLNAVFASLALDEEPEDDTPQIFVF